MMPLRPEEAVTAFDMAEADLKPRQIRALCDAGLASEVREEPRGWLGFRLLSRHDGTIGGFGRAQTMGPTTPLSTPRFR